LLITATKKTSLSSLLMCISHCMSCEISCVCLAMPRPILLSVPLFVFVFLNEKSHEQFVEHIKSMFCCSAIWIRRFNGQRDCIQLRKYMYLVWPGMTD